MKLNDNTQKQSAFVDHILRYAVLFFLLADITFSFGQEANIRLEQREIALNQYLSITLSVTNDKIREDNLAFPEIKGFRKAETQSSSSLSIINGRSTSEHSITQNYQAEKQGQYSIPAFKMKINGQMASFPGANVKVGEPVQQKVFNPWDIFEDPWGRRVGDPVKEDNLSAVAKDEAFFVVQPSQNSVYVGEGFTLTIAFYLLADNRMDYEFVRINEQKNEILKKVKPANCWEEVFETKNPELAQIGGKSYIKYMIHEAAYFPLNASPIQLPAQPLEMIRYKTAGRSLWGMYKTKEPKMFYSKQQTIQVKELPAHPLKDKVSVGQYKLKEAISANAVKTGESFEYSFRIVGEGNVSAIAKPEIPAKESFDIYSPNVSENIRRGNGQVYGIKQFNYYGIPNEPGSYPLADWFQWIYFNPKLEKYDTLASEIRLEVTGESKKNADIASGDLGGFYDQSAAPDNGLRPLSGFGYMKMAANILILAAIGLAAYVMLGRKKG